MMTTFAPSRTWTEVEIAALTPADIAHLNYHEMFELINCAAPSLAPLDTSHVTESDVLVRHVYALRQRCRSSLGCDNRTQVCGGS